jgi:peptide deformylase
MSVRRILTVDQDLKVLKQKSSPVDRVDDDLRALMDDMLETMYDAPGIGLAAIQVGVPKRVIVMDLSRGDGPKEPRFFVNPQIVWSSEELAPYEEGCLSVPEIYEEVQRPARVRVRYLGYDGAEVEEEAEGLFATCIQHEIDHLEGVLFIDYLSRLKRDRAVAKVRKAAKDEAA